MLAEKVFSPLVFYGSANFFQILTIASAVSNAL